MVDVFAPINEMTVDERNGREKSIPTSLASDNAGNRS
jgi:hypothetical protein